MSSRNNSYTITNILRLLIFCGSFYCGGTLFAAQQKITTTTSSNNNNTTALSYYKSGNSFSKEGAYQQAIDQHQKALAIREKQLEKNHPDIASSCHALGLIYGYVGGFDKARELLQEALTIRQTRTTDNHLDLTASYYSLGLIDNYEKNFEGAVELYNKAHVIREKLPEKGDPSVERITERLSDAKKKTVLLRQKTQGIEELLKKCHSVNEKILNNTIIKSLKKKFALDDKNFFNPGIKSRKRIVEKTKDDYDGDLNRVVDVVRFSLVCDNVKTLLDIIRDVAYDEFWNAQSIRVVRIKDRFKEPIPSSHYRDYTLILHTKEGIHIEMQSTLAELLEEKRTIHALYNESRKKGVLKTTEMYYNALAQQSYDKAWKTYEQDYEQLKDYFPVYVGEKPKRIPTMFLSKKLRVNSLPLFTRDHCIGRDIVVNTIADYFWKSNQIDDEKKYYDDDESKLKSLTLHGTSGIGKTTTALAYAYDNINKYMAIWWINASEKLTTMVSIKNIAIKLGKPYKKETKDEEYIQFVRRALAQKDNDPWLMIWDNADDITIVKKLQKELHPKQGIHVLITSRSDKWNNKTLNIAKLDDKAALSLLTAHLTLKNDSDKKAIATLIETLDGLPLALAQAAGYMEKYEITPTQLLNKGLAYSDKDNLAKGYNRGLNLNTLLLLELETAGNTSPLATTIAYVMAYLAPDDLPHDILYSLAKDETAFYNALGLLQGVITDNGNTYSIHRRKQDIIRDKLKSKKQEEEILMEAINLLTKCWKYDHDNLDTWTDTEAQAPHLQALWEHVENRNSVKLYNKLLNTINGLGDYLTNVKSALTNSITLLKSTVAKGEIYMPNSIILSTSYNNLGNTYADKGAYDKAIEFHEKALKISIATLGAKHPSVATSYNNLGIAYRSKGEYDKAIEFYEKALKIKLSTLGDNHPDTAITYNNLGLAYSNKGAYNKAIEFYLKDLKITLATLGDNHPSVATSYNNLGGVYDDKGDYDKAIEFYEKALKIKLATLGDNHPSVAASYNNLGIVYKNKGAYDKAIEFYEKALKIFIATLGANHPSVATSYNNLGNIYKNKGAYDKAIEFHEKALKIKLATLGDKHPSVATSYNNLGNIYINKGDYDKAIEFYEKALKIFIATLGESHPNTKVVMDNLTKTLKAQESYGCTVL